MKVTSILLGNNKCVAADIEQGDGKLRVLEFGGYEAAAPSTDIEQSTMARVDVLFKSSSMSTSDLGNGN